MLWRDDEPVSMGILKFRKVAPLVDLRQAGEWLRDTFNARNVYIRKVSNDQVGLGFTIRHQMPDSEKEMDGMLEKVTDHMKRKFGNDFLGWDIATPVSFLGIDG